MELENDNDLKFSLDCEINDKNRKTDSIRNALLQLHAKRSKLDVFTFLERQKHLLEEYSLAVDKVDGTNTFIDIANYFTKNSQRPIDQTNWNSNIHKSLKNNELDLKEFIVKANPNLESIMKLSDKFKETNKNRVLTLKSDNGESFSEAISSQDSNTSTSSLEALSFKSNKISNLIQKQIKSSPNRIRSNVEQSINRSPNRVSGIFRRKGFQAPRINAAAVSINVPKTSSSALYNRHKDENIKHNNLPPMVIDATENVTPIEKAKSVFNTGLEKHLNDQVLNNQLDPHKAQQILEETRKNMSNFKNPAKRMRSTCSGGSMHSENDSDNDNPLFNDPRLKGIERSMIELIQSEIISNLGNTDWSHIAGLENAKSKIQQIAILPLKRPDLFTGIRSPPKGILLFGPPGTGKTMIGRCIASQANATFFSITSSTLTSKWIGDGEKAMKTLFAIARCLKPSVIFIDEVDSLLKSRSDSEHDSSRRLKTEFLAQFDGLSNESNEGLLVIGTTNRPQELDEAVRRRFAAKLFISLPEKLARYNMILHHIKNEKHELTEEEIDLIAEKTEGYSGSDMKHLCSDAAMFSIKEVIEQLVNLEKDDIRNIRYEDFISALNTVKPSFSTEDLKDYEQWNKKFGSDH
ncbi:hypothetical protein RDWZM_006051 [Blomia tropicalis]|uniref:AAA+ ATPase domain-containing protein n=1 Tax=Blomia tropicalis TaxID=40697 RepID=A0A9Q0RMY3_BLOTA|nr:hypothetical protein RDWZM_006051 [Blomia tropicalis]